MTDYENGAKAMREAAARITEELEALPLPLPTPSVTLTGADFTEPGPVVDAQFHAGLGILHSAPAPDPRDEAREERDALRALLVRAGEYVTDVPWLIAEIRRATQTQEPTP